MYQRESEIKLVFQSLDGDEDGLLTHADLILMLERLVGRAASATMSRALALRGARFLRDRLLVAVLQELPATDDELDQMVHTMMQRANLTSPDSPNSLKQNYTKRERDMATITTI